ncbi:hypothetical protein J4573_34195 [Actinomadura barringtoniae]|uniref:Uncharacterized protein n=1 Tax=Actinomadura barringtoniae TaxID=1427535 RepID=A0A939T6P0_9ACTN|nr:hypothetical protein [Actinomadura barringtoniae]MBO2452183.1 hypothetical protein [Actinomadura barringtoniae]
MTTDANGYLATHYDLDQDPAISVPAQFTSGRHSVLRVTEGFLRRSGNVGRCIDSPTALGLKVADQGDERTRVSFRLSLDRHTESYWDRYVDESVSREEASKPRLVLVCAQRSLRGAALLVPKPSGKGRSIGEVAIDLAPGEVPPDGLALTELWGSNEWSGTHGWAGAPAALGIHSLDEVLAPAATIGMVVNGISIARSDTATTHTLGRKVDARTAERLGLVSTGGLNAKMLTEQGATRLTGGMMVVNPCTDAPVRLRFDWARAAAAGRTSTGDPRWKRHMDRARRKAWRVAQRGIDAAPLRRTPDRLQIGMITLGDGRVTSLSATYREEGGFEVTVPHSEEPFLLTFGQADGTGQPRLLKLVNLVRL